MLDDWSSLPTLYQAIDFYNFWYGVFDGTTGPTGRPVSLFTFALQQPQWPDPFTFKLVNLIIHLLNTFLIGVLTLFLIKPIAQFTSQQKLFLALSVALIWALLPIQVSTVLYVVQRMVLLSVFFTLLGLLGYLWGRNLLVQGKLKYGYAVMSITVGLCGLLAVFSKEIGLLLICYIWVAEITINQYTPYKTRVFSLWKSIYLLAPLVLYVAYIVFNSDSILVDKFTTRGFTLYERLITQPRVLWSYIAEIYFPQASNLTLFHEDYPISKSLLAPPSTIVALLLWITLVTVSVIYRKKLPLATFVILWYFLGHAMESNVLPLENYFDHRNYLPAYSLVLALVLLFAFGLSKISDPTLRKLYQSVGGIYFTVIVFVSLGQTNMWGDEVKFAYVQAAEHPHSIRARSLKAGVLLNSGRLEESYEEAKALRKDFPNETSTLLFNMEYACLNSKYTPTPLNDIIPLLKNAQFSHSMIKKLNNYIEWRAEKKCQNVDPQYVLAVIDVLVSNPLYTKRKSTLINFASLLELYLGNIDKAIYRLEQIQHKDFETHLQLARLYATSGQLDTATMTLKKAKQILKIGPHYRTNLNAIKELQHAIDNEMESASGSSEKQ